MNDQFKLSSYQDIEDFLTGCAFYGTGGGGDVKVGRTSLQSCLELGLDMVLMDPATISDNGNYCSAFFMGSIAKKAPEVIEEMKRKGYSERKFSADEMLIGAVRKLEAYTSKKMDGLIVSELGGTNSACCMSAAYKMGLPVINGDAAGRAIPEATQGLPAIKGINCLPAVYLDSWGNSSITTDAINYSAIERIGKFMSEASYGEMAEAAYVMSGREVKQALVPYTLTKALYVGHAINQSVKMNKDPLATAAKACGGQTICRGILRNIETKNYDGYYWGTYSIIENGANNGKEYKIWFKNENHILWVDGVPKITSPNLITVINCETGVPVLNSDLEEDSIVGVVASPAHKDYLSEDTIKVFGPRAFGFDFDYIPFDDILR